MGSKSGREAIFISMVREDISRQLVFELWITWWKEVTCVKIWGKSVPDRGTSDAKALRQEQTWPVWAKALRQEQYWGWSGVECPWGGASGMKWEVGEIEAKFYRDLLAMVRNLDFRLNAEECYLENFKQRNRMIWSGLLFRRSTRLLCVEWIMEWGWSCKERPPLCAGVMERVRLDGFWRYGHLNLLMWDGELGIL